jgi:RNA polymerase sigma-70 factor (ECF subfamily)
VPARLGVLTVERAEMFGTEVTRATVKCMDDPGERTEAADAVVALYRSALPKVYGYLLPRCGSVSLAEDLTSETFLAAIRACRTGGMAEVSMPWLVGVARHKLVDYWRKREREERTLTAVEASEPEVDDPWDAWLDTETAYAALARLSPIQRAALTLRYLDGLPVALVAEHLGRSVHATETLLVRSRGAFRRYYGARDTGDRHGS